MKLPHGRDSPMPLLVQSGTKRHRALKRPGYGPAMGDVVSIVLVAVGGWGLAHPQSLHGALSSFRSSPRPMPNANLMRLVGLLLVVGGVLTLFNIGNAG